MVLVSAGTNRHRQLVYQRTYSACRASKYG
jgi:hypothetical protein